MSDEFLPPRYGGCSCWCHLFPGVYHVAACCTPPYENEPAPLIVPPPTMPMGYTISVNMPMHLRMESVDAVRR